MPRKASPPCLHASHFKNETRRAGSASAFPALFLHFCTIKLFCICVKYATSTNLFCDSRAFFALTVLFKSDTMIEGISCRKDTESHEKNISSVLPSALRLSRPRRGGCRNHRLCGGWRQRRRSDSGSTARRPHGSLQRARRGRRRDRHRRQIHPRRKLYRACTHRRCHADAGGRRDFLPHGGRQRSYRRRQALYPERADHLPEFHPAQHGRRIHAARRALPPHRL